MGKRVLFLVVEKGQDKINEITKAGVNDNLGKEDALVFVNGVDFTSELYYTLKGQANKIINDVNNFDYVCVIPNGAVLNNEAKAIFEEYQADRDDNIKEIYLPLAMYRSSETTVVLNKHIWNSMISFTAGVLDIDLALKQIDSTIFGAFIPTELFFSPDNYQADLKYYQQYHLLSNLADGDNLTLGIPKILVTLSSENYDFMMTGLSNEEKIASFNQAREKWAKKEEAKLTQKEEPAQA